MKSSSLNSILRLTVILVVLALCVSPVMAQQLTAAIADGPSRPGDGATSDAAKAAIKIGSGLPADPGSGAGAPPSTALPRVIKYSGALPVVDGVTVTTAQITFSLFNEQSGGSPLWTETHTVELDATGHYSVLLGSTNGGGMPTDLFSSDTARWLAVQVQGQPEAARSLLVSVPYALKAVEAERLAGRAATDYISADQLDAAVKAAVASQANNNISRPKS